MATTSRPSATARPVSGAPSTPADGNGRAQAGVAPTCPQRPATDDAHAPSDAGILEPPEQDRVETIRGDVHHPFQLGLAQRVDPLIQVSAEACHIL